MLADQGQHACFAISAVTFFLIAQNTGGWIRDHWIALLIGFIVIVTLVVILALGLGLGLGLKSDAAMDNVTTTARPTTLGF